MTNDEYRQLVEFLGHQFTQIDRRFESIDQRFEQIDRQFGAMDRRLVTMESRFDARFDAIEQQLRNMLGHFDEVYRRLERLEQEYYTITQGLRRIEALLVDEVTRREIVERSVAELKEQVAILRARIEALERRIRE